MTIHGSNEAAFAPVRDAFARNFDAGLEIGAAVCVTHHGRTVVDLWGGDADTAGTPWQRDTLVGVWSITKTMTSICVLMLADRGVIDLDDPVARYWPEFAAAGKEGVLIRHVLSHSSGLPAWDPPISVDDLYDAPRVASLLAAQAPWWPPGTVVAYHPLTQGVMLDAIARAASGRSIAEFLRTEVTGPLGADFFIGLPESEAARTAAMIPPAFSLEESQAEAIDDSLATRIYGSPPTSGDEPNTAAWRAAELPASNGFGTARGIARVHSALACGGSVDGVRLLSAPGVERILEEQSNGIDLSMGSPMRHGLGFGLMNETFDLSPSPRSFYWGGWGGSVSVIDLDEELTVTYVMNRMDVDLLGDQRGNDCVRAAYASLDGGAGK